MNNNNNTSNNTSNNNNDVKKNNVLEPKKMYEEQVKKRINFMPWLYDIEKHNEYHKKWQIDWQRQLSLMETIEFIGDNTFIADEDVNVFAERGRKIVIENNCRVATGCYLHGPLHFKENVGLNKNVHLEGGVKGICIGKNTRIGPNTSMFAFNHSFDCLEIPIREQKVSSRGIEIGEDVWIGANCSIVDGVVIGSSAVIGIASVVTKDVPEFEIWAGNPARKIGHRRKG